MCRAETEKGKTSCGKQKQKRALIEFKDLTDDICFLEFHDTCCKYC